MTAFEFNKELVIEEVTRVCEDCELDDVQTENVISTVLERCEWEGFKTWGEFFAFLDGLLAA